MDSTSDVLGTAASFSGTSMVTSLCILLYKSRRNATWLSHSAFLTQPPISNLIPPPPWENCGKVPKFTETTPAVVLTRGCSRKGGTSHVLRLSQYYTDTTPIQRCTPCLPCRKHCPVRENDGIPCSDGAALARHKRELWSQFKDAPVVATNPRVSAETGRTQGHA